MKLNYKRTVLVGFAFFLISAFWQAYDAIVPLILTNHYGLPQSASGAIMSLDNVLAVFLLPIFGAISDRVTSRYGRRTPFVLIGTLAAVVAFFVLTLIDNIQLTAVLGTDIPTLYKAARSTLEAAQTSYHEAVAAGNTAGAELASALVSEAEAALEEVRRMTLGITQANAASLVGFIATLLVLLIAMATFRSPAVALMPDVTVKPLRSKGNAVINLMGAAGGIIVLVLGMIFGTAADPFMKYTGYVLAVCLLMLAALVVFILTVKEKAWAAEMEADTVRLGLEEPEEAADEAAARHLSRPEFCSLLLILASVALWYIGYNSITSKYSVYATNVLFFDYNFTLIIAQAAAIISYIPVGILSSKLGRKKTILIGIVLLATAFFAGNFITMASPELIMYPIFILAGIGWATINVNSFPMVVELARGGDVGKYTGFYYTASMAAQIVAPILSGFLYDAFGMRQVFFAFGTVFVALSFLTMLFVRHGDAKPEARIGLEALDTDD